MDCVRKTNSSFINTAGVFVVVVVIHLEKTCLSTVIRLFCGYGHAPPDQITFAHVFRWQIIYNRLWKYMSTTILTTLRILLTLSNRQASSFNGRRQCLFSVFTKECFCHLILLWSIQPKININMHLHDSFVICHRQWEFVRVYLCSQRVSGGFTRKWHSIDDILACFSSNLLCHSSGLSPTNCFRIVSLWCMWWTVRPFSMNYFYRIFQQIVALYEIASEFWTFHGIICLNLSHISQQVK